MKKLLTMSMILLLCGPSFGALKKNNGGAPGAQSMGQYGTQARPSAPPLTQQEQQILSRYDVSGQIKQRNEQKFIHDTQGLEDYPGEIRDVLSRLELVLLIDKSGSQTMNDVHPEDKLRNMQVSQRTGLYGNNRWTQWDNTLMATKYLSESLFEYDQDGTIPVIFFGNFYQEVLAQNPGDILHAFQDHRPQRESTNLYDALKYAFDKHLNGADTLFIVITDGQPNSGQEDRIKRLIYERLSMPDPEGEHLNILFLRIGDDGQAIKFLEHLDDCREIGKNVDTKEDDDLYKHGPKNLILNGITEHLDQTLYGQNNPNQGGGYGMNPHYPQQNPYGSTGQYGQNPYGPQRPGQNPYGSQPNYGGQGQGGMYPNLNNNQRPGGYPQQQGQAPTMNPNYGSNNGHPGYGQAPRRY